MSEWISVRHSFPPHLENVLLFTGHKEVVIGFYFHEASPVDPWATEDTIFINDLVNGKIRTASHWMLLPKAPHE